MREELKAGEVINCLARLFCIAKLILKNENYNLFLQINWLKRVWSWKRWKGIGQRRCQETQKSPQRQHPRYHEACYPSSCKKRWCQAYSDLIYEETRGVLKVFLTNVIRDAVTYTKHARRKTVTALDVLERQGRALVVRTVLAPYVHNLASSNKTCKVCTAPYVSTQRYHGSSMHIYFHETFNDQLPIDAFDFVISSCNLTFR
jgi:hypothetical protein